MKMTQPAKPTPNQDDLLADFTDRVLAEKTAALASSSDAELRGLEQTTLRLTQVFPKATVDDKTVRRMQADFKSRMRKANSSSRSVAWQSQRTRQRFGLALIAVAIIVAVFLITPFVISGNGSLTASAGLQNESLVGLLIVLAGVLLFIFWLGRRK